MIDPQSSLVHLSSARPESAAMLKTRTWSRRSMSTLWIDIIRIEDKMACGKTTEEDADLEMIHQRREAYR